MVLSSALELENLDYNELEATMDEIDLALSQHLPEARQARGPHAEQELRRDLKRKSMGIFSHLAQLHKEQHQTT